MGNKILPTEFEDYANSMHNLGNVIYTDFKTVYDKIGSLATAVDGWQGERYNEVVECLNNMKKGFEAIVQDIEKDMPEYIMLCASKFSENTKTFVSTKEYPTEELTELGTTDGDSLVFGTPEGDTTTIQKAGEKSVESLNDIVEKQLDNVLGIVNDMDQVWYGQVKKKTEENITTYKNNIQNDISKFSNTFDECFKKRRQKWISDNDLLMNSLKTDEQKNSI